MKLAIIGSRNITHIDEKELSTLIPHNVSEIVSGGASGIDRIAADYAHKSGIKLTEFLPEYNRYRRAAPLKRNEAIARYADEALAIWDGRSKGTKHTIELFYYLGKKVTVILKENTK